MTQENIQCCFCNQDTELSRVITNPKTGKRLCQYCVGGMGAMMLVNIIWPGATRIIKDEETPHDLP